VSYGDASDTSGLGKAQDFDCTIPTSQASSVEHVQKARSLVASQLAGPVLAERLHERIRSLASRQAWAYALVYADRT
jgi:hypothetical protein